MNLLESLDAICEPDLPAELIPLRNKWEKQDGGWDAETKKSVETDMLKNPDVSLWVWIVDGLGWTQDVPDKLDTLYGLLEKADLISHEVSEASKQDKIKLSPAAQVREGKALSAWLREERETDQRQQQWRMAA